MEDFVQGSQDTYFHGARTGSQETTGSQITTRASDEVYEWDQPLFVQQVATPQPAYFYMVVFAVNNTPENWLVKVGITRATVKKFKERYSIYYRHFFYKIIPLIHCNDDPSFVYYDAQQKEKINNNNDIVKFKTTTTSMETEKQRPGSWVHDFDIHVAESTGEVYRLSALADLEFIAQTLTAVAEVPYPYPAVISLPSRSKDRIKLLDRQLFDFTRRCFATTLYRDGHFSSDDHPDGYFDFPLSITSVRNICSKLYEKIKYQIFKCTWRRQRWELRILWVGIGMAEESILVVLYFRQLGVFIHVVGLDLTEDAVKHARQSVAQHGLGEHFNIIKQDVLQYAASEMEKHKIDIIYTSAVANYIFMWKLHMLGVASTRVQALVAPLGGIANLHNIEGKEGSFTGPPLGLYPVRRSPKVINVFCNECKVAASPYEDSNDGLLTRELRFMKYTDDMHTQRYLDIIGSSGRIYQMETALKQATLSGSQDVKDKLAVNMDSNRMLSHIFVGEFKIDIETCEWVEWEIRQIQVRTNIQICIISHQKKNESTNGFAENVL